MESKLRIYFKSKLEVKIHEREKSAESIVFMAEKRFSEPDEFFSRVPFLCFIHGPNLTSEHLKGLATIGYAHSSMRGVYWKQSNFMDFPTNGRFSIWGDMLVSPSGRDCSLVESSTMKNFLTDNVGERMFGMVSGMNQIESPWRRKWS